MVLHYHKLYLPRHQLRMDSIDLDSGCASHRSMLASKASHYSASIETFGGHTLQCLHFCVPLGWQVIYPRPNGLPGGSHHRLLDHFQRHLAHNQQGLEHRQILSNSKWLGIHDIYDGHYLHSSFGILFIGVGPYVKEIDHYIPLCALFGTIVIFNEKYF